MLSNAALRTGKGGLGAELGRFFVFGVSQIFALHVQCKSGSGVLVLPLRCSWPLDVFVKHVTHASPAVGVDDILTDFVESALEVSSLVHALMQLIMDGWQMQILRGTEDTVRRFHAASVCCLDQGFCEPLRYAYPTFDIFKSLGGFEMLHAIRKDGPRTNMGHEGLLAEIKAACRPLKGLPTIENFSYAAKNTQVWKQFVARGGSNPWVETKDTLQRAGVQLETQVTAKGSPRPHLMWFNVQMRNARQQHAADFTEKGTRKALSKKWAAMTAKERMQAVATTVIGEEDAGLARGRQYVERAKPRLSKAVLSVDRFMFPEWLYTNGRLPLDPAIVTSFLGHDAGNIGIVEKGQKFRWEARRSIHLADTGHIHPETNLCRRLSCQERHPGLCCSRDAAIYSECLVVAANIERFVTSDTVHRFMMLTSADFEKNVPFYVSHRRTYRQHNCYQIVGCVDADFKATMDGVAPDQAELVYNAGGSWAFTTVWTIAKEFLETGAVEGGLIYSERPRWKRRSKDDFYAEIEWANLAEHIKMFPGIYKPPKREKEEEDWRLKDLEAPKPKRVRPKRAKIETWVGVPTKKKHVEIIDEFESSSDEPEADPPPDKKKPNKKSDGFSGGEAKPEHPKAKAKAVAKAKARRAAAHDNDVVGLEGRTFVILRSGEAVVGFSLACAHHEDEGCFRNLSFGKENPMGEEEAQARLLRWERAGAVHHGKGSKELHRALGLTPLLRNFSSEVVGPWPA